MVAEGVRQLKHLCRDDTTALDAIDRATVGEQGAHHNNVMKSEQGNANTYALRKLRKDRPDLHARVLAEEISPHAVLSVLTSENRSYPKLEAASGRSDRTGGEGADRGLLLNWQQLAVD